MLVSNEYDCTLVLKMVVMAEILDAVLGADRHIISTNQEQLVLFMFIAK